MCVIYQGLIWFTWVPVVTAYFSTLGKGATVPNIMLQYSKDIVLCM